MDAKHILTSKTLWLNIAGIAASWGGILPQQYALPTMTIANIGLRLLTNQPVTFDIGTLKKQLGLGGKDGQDPPTTVSGFPQNK